MALDTSQLPQHVAIIMDGNRRWAKAHGMNPLQGHQQVVDGVIEELVDRCIELNIPHLTLWAFSTENWERDRAELQGMMQLFRYGLNKKTESLFEKGVRLRVLGDLNRFPQDIADLSRKWMEVSKNNTKINVTFALNYGGRDEVTRAFNRFLEAQGDKNIKDITFTEKDMAPYLDTADLPDPDLIIRPGGQFRLSGFMPWQSVYAELYFSDILMPDFGAEQFDEALADYQSRQRRFGR
jgi:undecaprenyl diphosphate synthase